VRSGFWLSSGIGNDDNVMTPLPRKSQQSSLDSFFGTKPVGAAKKSGPKQKKIESFFSSSAAAAAAAAAAVAVAVAVAVSASSKATPVVTGSEPCKENANVRSQSTKKDATESDPPLPKTSAQEATDSMDSTPTPTTSDQRNEEDECEGDADGPVVRKTKRVGRPAQTSKRRRVIHDDSDDDEADKDNVSDGEKKIKESQPTNVQANDKVDATRVKPDSPDDDALGEDDKVPAASADKGERKGDAQTKSPPASAPQTSRGTTAVSKTTTSGLRSKSSNRSNKTVASENDKLDDALSDAQEDDAAETAAPKSSVAKKTTTKKPLTKSDLAKGPYKTDEAVISAISSSVWTTGADMPYAVLCQAFVKIEAISGRLDIQEILTTLFRQIMLQQCFSDMSPVVYLASNSVAAAYECVELGIGDALLIKAIGEATGATPAKIKPKYEAVGDLGTVAQSLKSKQSTLGGYFAATKKTSTKDYLTAKQVLDTFRQIAETKGNNSQTLKVNLIKKLLVQTTDPCETKYIIRGLQGKLRIGLARSTVLISLAHALALTIPKTIATDSSGTAIGMSELFALSLSFARCELPVLV
jgi:DNA ligase 1